MSGNNFSTIQRNSVISFPAPGLTLNPPDSFSLFGRTIYLYGVIIAFAFLIGILYCSKNAKRIGASEEDIYDVLLRLLPVSILGARIYYVLFELDYYLAHPREIAAVWEGGLAIYGGVIAGAAVIFFFTRRRKISTLAFMDLFLTACILGQAIGRWGNFTNREAFGRETTIFCRMGLTDVTGQTIYVHPTFLYESLWNFVGFLLMNRILRRGRRFDGECLAFYCFWYGTGRAVIEGLRTDSLYIPGTQLRISQLLSVILAFAGLSVLTGVFIRHRKTGFPSPKNGDVFSGKRGS